MKKKLVFVGMSGGVDSSVSAYLLKKSGYEVVGVFIQVWQPEGFPCTSKEDRLDAMRVAAQLDIPFITLDLEQEYKQGVIDYMLSEYKRGNTPNPDVMCNKEVKFGAFLSYARKKGADYVATGHYAQIEHQKTYSALKTSIDQEKDQTYFLWTLQQEQLQHILFPVGNLLKSEVRSIAEKQNIYTAPKKDSQGLCFVGNIPFKDLLKQYLQPEQGNVLDEQGDIIGFHDGSILYTTGERHGFTITHKTPHSSKLFVISRDIDANTITVSPHKPELHEQITQQILHLREYSYTRTPALVGQRVYARYRYRGPLVEATITDYTTHILKLHTEQPISVASGQSVVLYSASGKDAEVIGGGIIEKSYVTY